MDGERGKRLRSFLLGGLVGSAAGLAAAGRMRIKQRPPGRETPAGLAAFEQAPCYEEVVERESRPGRSGRQLESTGRGSRARRHDSSSDSR
jgi:hypothetical protein